MSAQAFWIFQSSLDLWGNNTGGVHGCTQQPGWQGVGAQGQCRGGLLKPAPTHLTPGWEGMGAEHFTGATATSQTVFTEVLVLIYTANR